MKLRAKYLVFAHLRKIVWTAKGQRSFPMYFRLLNALYLDTERLVRICLQTLFLIVLKDRGGETRISRLPRDRAYGSKCKSQRFIEVSP